MLLFKKCLAEGAPGVVTKVYLNVKWPTAEALEWMGGYFEGDWSVNPHWVADFKELPKHTICNGVVPFSTKETPQCVRRWRKAADNGMGL